MQAVKKRNVENLYTNVRRICQERQISIAQLEREAGLGNGVVRKWTHTSPTLRTVFAVTDYLGVTLDDLLK